MSLSRFLVYCYGTLVGDIVIDLFCEACPRTTRNFLKLCKAKYYNNCLFHNVQRDFIAQTGDPTGTGRGGDSVYCMLYGENARFFDDELRPSLRHKKRGVVSMTSSGPNTNASQFFITLRDDLDYLDDKHTIFGQIAEGFDELDKINSVFVDEKMRPLKNIRIRHTRILDDPFPDPDGFVYPPDSPVHQHDQHDVDYLADDDTSADAVDMRSTEELEKDIKIQEAKSRAVVLEMIGDLPDADVKPPENVLFVCKLNAVTTDEDLEVIFSQFGAIKKCEVIRDWKTKDSLQYAFIEFENDEDSERAYFKMENALIDDRRIHVDFSQSVSKLWNRYARGDRSMVDASAGGMLISGPASRERGGKLQLKGSGPVHAEKHQMLFEHDIEATASAGSVKAKVVAAKVTLARTSGNISHGSQIASGNASNSGTHQQNRSESSRRDGDRRMDRRSRSRSPRHRGTVSYDRRYR